MLPLRRGWSRPVVELEARRTTISWHCPGMSCWWMLIQLFIEVYSMPNEGLRQGVQCLFCRNAQGCGHMGADRGSMHEPHAVIIHDPIHWRQAFSDDWWPLVACLRWRHGGKTRLRTYISNFCCRWWTKALLRPTIDGGKLLMQDTASAVERDRSPHPKSLYLQSTDACTASFFLSILRQNSWCQVSNVLVRGEMPSEELLVSCLSAGRVRGSAILCYHDCCHRISLTFAHWSSCALTAWFYQVAAPKQPCDDQPLFTPSAQRPWHVRRQSLPVWTPTIFLPLSTNHRVLNFDCAETSGRLRGTARAGNAWGAKREVQIFRKFAAILTDRYPLPPIFNEFNLPAKCKFLIRSLRGAAKHILVYRPVSIFSQRVLTGFPCCLFLFTNLVSQSAVAARVAPVGVKWGATFLLVFLCLKDTLILGKFFIGFRRAKST